MAEGTPIAVELAVPDDAAVGVAWEAGAVAGGEAQPWRLKGEIDWRRVESLRVLSASLEDGTVLGAAALRPAGAAGHGEDSVAVAIRDPDGEEVPVAEALLSTEYGPDGEPRRLGLELWPPGDGVPLRVAAEVETEDATGPVLPLTVRSEGRSGSGLLHVLRES